MEYIYFDAENDNIVSTNANVLKIQTNEIIRYSGFFDPTVLNLGVFKTLVSYYKPKTIRFDTTVSEDSIKTNRLVCDNFTIYFESFSINGDYPNYLGIVPINNSFEYELTLPMEEIKNFHQKIKGILSSDMFLFNIDIEKSKLVFKNETHDIETCFDVTLRPLNDCLDFNCKFIRMFMPSIVNVGVGFNFDFIFKLEDKNVEGKIYFNNTYPKSPIILV